MAKLTEQDWLAARTVSDLDLYRTTKGQHRKWRLFGVACARRAMAAHFPDPRLEPLAVVAEQMADGLISWDDAKRVRKVLTAVRRQMGEQFGPDEARIAVLYALDLATLKSPLASLGVETQAVRSFRAATRLHLTGDDRFPRRGSEYHQVGEAEEAEQLRLACEVFGNPFRPVAFDPTWRSATVEAIADGVYADRAFDRLPVLADALEDAGCDAADLLAHLRGPGPHVRGCWAVDLVLGKA